MDQEIPDWVLIALGVLADLAVLYGGVRLFRRLRRRTRTDAPLQSSTPGETRRDSAT